MYLQENFYFLILDKEEFANKMQIFYGILIYFFNLYKLFA